MIKGPIYQEDIKNPKYTEPKNSRSLKYMEQNLTELKEKIDKSTVMVGDLKFHLSIQ